MRADRMPMCAGNARLALLACQSAAPPSCGNATG